MILPGRLDEALKRLNGALDQLDAAAARRADVEAVKRNLEDELAVMQDDRSRLAVELDAALARARTLAVASDDARERLQRSADALRTLLTQDSPNSSPSSSPVAGNDGKAA